MRTMIIISAILSLFISCEKTPEPVPNLIKGNWGLVQTELYKNGDLNGRTPASEISTYYQFENCGENNTECRLIVREDGEEGIYNYTYSALDQKLVINASNVYQVEVLNETTLVFYKDYQPYKSIYTFEKVE